MCPTLSCSYRHLAGTLLAVGLAMPALAQVDTGIALDFDEAAQLAVQRQPLLEAQAAQARAARERSVSAAQLPDPMLTGGLADLTMTGRDRFTLRTESDTQFMVGVKQAFPGGDKRSLRGMQGLRDAERLDAELAEQRRMIRREAALAWLDVWKAVEAQAVVRSSQKEAQRQLDAVDIAFRSGRGQQADLLAARVSLELLADQHANLQQQEWHARNQLRRWIGDEADRVLCPDLPAFTAPDEARLLAHLATHPHVTAQTKAVEAAQAGLELAREAYKPDWSVQVGYGYRPEYADYASVNFEVGLPVFRRDRQDREVAAQAATVEAAAALREDWLRQHRATIRLNAQDWQRLQQRIARYDEVILPDAAKRTESALASYAAGSGALVPVLDARRSLQDIRMQRLDLLIDATRHQINLQYLAPEENPS